ncbi:hypothetical protein CLSAB_18910 [Clostridium saccharobutylicum]|uniref:hypothetical protein n=1 Tax=Clostridium saccharobutylicum TaxID=169679 RepID=UPI00098CA71E|nr:hypothetical protein [Clostridium saccharobutylicum]OOM17171.1 hypothetical protein CLSAB_18910 [Clostridium saccharobutylicum]
MILAIDPGNIESGYVFTNDDLSVIEKGKIVNEEMLKKISELFLTYGHKIKIAIEMIASYGMSVGVEVFETCLWIGRFIQEIFIETQKEPILIYRKDEKMNLCQSMKANDATIKRALVDRFAPGQKNYGKGTKKAPGFFYGFSKDMWAAMAVAVTYYDKYITKTFK